MLGNFQFGRRQVGPGNPCLIVAEVGLAHDGSINLAHSYIDAIADAGADVAKFQAYNDAPEGIGWRIEPPSWSPDRTRDEYRQRTMFTYDQWEEIGAHCERRGIEFLVSPFSVWAVEWLNPLVKAWKVASGEVTNYELLDAIKATGKPAILSTGMSTHDENIEACLRFDIGKMALMQCTSLYPCPPDKIDIRFHINVNQLPIPVGLSDHSGSIYPSIGAVALGANIVEVHVTFSRQIWGFDASSSITIPELAEMVRGIRIVEQALKPVDKDLLAKELQPMRDLFMRQPCQAE